jgi:lauroyl/myristoyl acyltransferase
MSAAERDAIARASLDHIDRVGGEVITMHQMAARVDEVVEATPETIATVERVRARGKGIVFVLGHRSRAEPNR